MPALHRLLPALVLCGLCALVTPALAAPKLTPSAPLKAYKGPEGELIIMVEVNDGAEMLVQFKNIGGPFEGKALLYLVDDQGKGRKDVYVDKKRGSKTYRSYVLSLRDGTWELYHPGKPGTHFSLRYSEAASEKLKIDDVLKAYQP